MAKSVASVARRRCSAIIFDMDDTLVPTSRIDREAIAMASAHGARAIGLVERDVADRFRALLASEPFPPPGSAVHVTDWRTALWARALGGGGSDDGGASSEALAHTLASEVHSRWRAARLGSFVLSTEVRDMVERFHVAGYKTAIVTNGHSEIQRGKLAACDAAALFGERVVVSGEQPEFKPAASIFHTALALIDARADETVMVGDSLANDVQGGINAGLLATVWVRGEGADEQPPPPPGAPEPTFTIGTVLELEAVLARLS